jgi:hypothetical protein
MTSCVLEELVLNERLLGVAELSPIKLAQGIDKPSSIAHVMPIAASSLKFKPGLASYTLSQVPAKARIAPGSTGPTVLDAGTPILQGERVSDERHTEEYKEKAGADSTPLRGQQPPD